MKPCNEYLTFEIAPRGHPLTIHWLRSSNTPVGGSTPRTLTQAQLYERALLPGAIERTGKFAARRSLIWRVHPPPSRYTRYTPTCAQHVGRRAVNRTGSRRTAMFPPTLGCVGTTKARTTISTNRMETGHTHTHTSPERRGHHMDTSRTIPPTSDRYQVRFT